MDKKIQRLSPLTESTFYILLALKQPLHGYGIIKEVEEMTHGRLRLAAGTLYGALQNLQKYQLITLYSEETSGKKKKEYVITDIGLELLHYEVDRIDMMLQNARR